MNKLSNLFALLIITLIGTVGCRNDNQQDSSSSVMEAQASLTGDFKIIAIGQDGKQRLIGNVNSKDLSKLQAFIVSLSASKEGVLDAKNGKVQAGTEGIKQNCIPPDPNCKPGIDIAKPITVPVTGGGNIPPKQNPNDCTPPATDCPGYIKE